MLVSIIIPCHKTTPYLKACVLSALNQTYSKIEVLLICNGTLEIDECRSFLNFENNKLLFYRSEQGRHKARNKGIKVAKGGYLQFLDFDDILYPNKIELQLKAIDESNSTNAISISKWDIFYKEIKNKKDLDLDYLFEKKIIPGIDLYKLLGKNKGYIMTASWLFPKPLVTENILWEDVPNDDALFVSEIIDFNTIITTIPEILTGYRNHEGNTRSIRTKEELNRLKYSWNKIRRNLDFNDYLVQRYFYNAYFYLLKYSINCRGYKFFSIYFIFLKLGFNAKIPFKMVLRKNSILFNKTVGLITKRFLR